MTITEQITAISSDRKTWIRKRAVALVRGVVRAVGMPTERGSYRLLAVFAQTHGLNAGEQYLAESAALDALARLEAAGHHTALGLG